MKPKAITKPALITLNAMLYSAKSDKSLYDRAAFLAGQVEAFDAQLAAAVLAGARRTRGKGKQKTGAYVGTKQKKSARFGIDASKLRRDGDFYVMTEEP